MIMIDDDNDKPHTPLTGLEQRICADLAGRADELFAQLSAHVAIPTGKGYRPGLDKYRTLLTDRLTKLGATIELHPGAPRPLWMDATPAQPLHDLERQSATTDESAATRHIPETVVARHHQSEARNNAQRVLIAGHMDTVHDPDGPFQTLTKSADGRTAVGPGAADMKGGILIAVAALEAIARANIRIGWTFLLNADEETGSCHSGPILRAEARQHDVGLALEPALPGGALAIERMGSGQFMIEVFGKSAHVGRDFAAGISAVVKLSELIVELSRWPDPARGLILNVGPLRGGLVTNSVPDYAACWGNVRFKNPDIGRDLEERLGSLATAPGGDALPRVAVHTSFNRPAKPRLPGSEKLAQLAADQARRLGQDLPLVSTGGVCDGNILQDAGLPAIDTLGVRGGGLHTPDEWIEVASLVQRSQLFALLMLKLACP